MHSLEQMSHLKYGNTVSVTVKGKLLKLLVLTFQCIFSTEIDKMFSVNPSPGTRMRFCYLGKGSLGLNPLILHSF